jgi:hypothetical protein
VQRYRQTFEEILALLSPIETEWRDDFAGSVIGLISQFPDKETFEGSDLERLLRADFEAGLTVARLFLDLSKDEFVGQLHDRMGGTPIGIKSFLRDPVRFMEALESLGTLGKMQETVSRPTTWRDVLTERLKSGRGSAIKGQRRGRALENFTEELVKSVFGESFDKRCRFIGAAGQSTEKADFAIPSKEEPRILIEVKAYGATGSKQTDILGDMARIVAEKRHDTTFLLVTDGITWKYRPNDLRKLIEMQNLGRITRIYTSKMNHELLRDLQQLRGEHAL